MNSDSLSSLNLQQQRAVTFGQGPLLILAGAGSGKTRCLTYRVSWLMSEKLIDPSRILLLTFTNKAAGEMKNRVAGLISDLHPSSLSLRPSLPWSGTFHSWCAWILRKHAAAAGLKPEWVIYDEDDREQLAREIIRGLDLPGMKIKPRSAMAAISEAKNELISAVEYLNYARGEWQESVARIYLEYQKRLKQFGALDFDDLLLETVRLFESNTELLGRYQELIQYLLVDEYQDTNAVQYKLTRQLAGRHRNLTVVGDMAQSIYTFRGANFRNLLNLKRDFPDLTEIKLEQNYRSHQHILDAAHNVIRHNHQHPVLKLWTDKQTGDRPKLFCAVTEAEEAQFIVNRIDEDHVRANGQFHLNNYAILYRTNAQSRVFEEALLAAAIPYVLIGGIRFYQRAEIKDCLAYLRLLFNPTDKVSEIRTLKIGQKRYADFRALASRLASGKSSDSKPEFLQTTRELLNQVLSSVRYLDRYDPKDPDDQVRIENVKELLSVAESYPKLGEFLEQVALVEDAQLKQSDSRDAVVLMTLHSAKGLEFPTVFLVGLEEGLLPHSRSMMKTEDLEEERRLIYVGITRAMDNLYLSHARSRLYFGSRGISIPSRFIGEIGEENLERI